MIVLCIHLMLLFVGLVMGGLLLLAIVRSTPAAVKNYSVLLLLGASNDLVAIIADLSMMERLTTIFPTFVYIPNGPCTLISLELCNFCNTLFDSTMAETMVIQCVSFWYRLRILSKPPPGTLALNIIVAVCTLPYFAASIYYNQLKRNLFHDPALLKTLQILYPKQNWTGVFIYGLPDFREFAQLASWGNFVVPMPLMFIYLVVTRHRVIRALRRNHSISDKTRAMHRVFVKILTIHAILPITTIVGLAAVTLLVLGFVHPELEELLYVMGTFAPVAMPAVTIYFMNPYKEYISRLLHCGRINRLILPYASSSNAQSNSNEETMTRF